MLKNSLRSGNIEYSEGTKQRGNLKLKESNFYCKLYHNIVKYADGFKSYCSALHLH